MKQAIDLKEIYSLRKDFTIIGLTGRTGSGCTEVAKALQDGFVENPSVYPLPKLDTLYNHNSFRKYRIIFDFAKQNFKPFTLIEYKNALCLFIFQYNISEFIAFLQSEGLSDCFDKSAMKSKANFISEVAQLNKLSSKWKFVQKRINAIDFENIKINRNTKELHKLFDLFFNQKSFSDLCKAFHETLSSTSKAKRIKVLQVISNNIRRTGNSFDFTHGSELKNTFTIVNRINDLIKAHRVEQDRTQIVIDSLRNPIEAMYFKERYSAFYLISVNRENSSIQKELKKRFKGEITLIDIIIKEEFNKVESHEFYKQNVADCIQKSDIHLSFISEAEAKKFNDNLKAKNENTSPKFSWQRQILKYMALISQPGIVTPSPEERCMQLAYTAKYNSGCISRKVGAAITDEYYSLKAIGWNNTPEGQVPCVLRNVVDLIKEENDMHAFTRFELKNKQFKKELKKHFNEDLIDANKEKLLGRPVCFCFKSIKNSYDEGKNQVHTRSLHAEENAFLQLSKYGGTGIKNGKLFTTASPCELCAKKAFQLGIKVIYYVDPYPGISEDHILRPELDEIEGKKSFNIEMRLFHGAIGNAYHWLYDSFMAYKDELALLLGQEIEDLTKKQKRTITENRKSIAEKDKEINLKDKEIFALKKEIETLKKA
jgi:deoxycytidylate deaminase